MTEQSQQATMTQENVEQQDPLLTQLRDCVDDICKNRVDTEVTLEKTHHYLRLRKADLYYRGLQFIAPSLSSGYPDYTPVGTPAIPGSDDAESRGLFDYNIDIVRSYGRKYFGVLGLRPFHNVKALPEDPENEADRNAAKQANAVSVYLKQKWGLRKRNIELFYHQWKSGTVWVFHPYLADVDLFGEVEEPQFVEDLVEVEPAGYLCPNCHVRSAQPLRQDVLNSEGQAVEQLNCPACQGPLHDYNYEEAQSVPVPKLAEVKKYPGSGPAFYLCTGYTITVPFDGVDPNKLPWLVYEHEENQGKLIQTFGETLRAKLKDGATGSGGIGSQQGVLSRAMAASLTATPRQGMANRWTYGRYWLSTEMYEYVEDKAKRDALYQNFPDGLKVHKVNDLTVKLENERLCDVWTPITAEPGDTLYQDPGCWGILGHQDMKNDLANIGMALLERGLPAFLVDPDVINAEALASKPYSPMELYEAKPGVGARLDNAVKMLPAASFPEHLMPFDESIDQNAQTHTGLLPTVYGGGERQPTAEGQRTMLNQALMQLGVPGEYAQVGYADIFLKACKLIEKFAPKAIKVPGSSDVIDPEALRAGKYYFTSEPGIPMSWGERRDAMMQVISQNPDVAHAMFLDDPQNSDAIKEYVLSGMPELHSPTADIRNYVMEAIRLLLTAQPTPDPMGGPPQPSLPADEFVDPSLYATVAKIAQEWLISGQGLKAKQAAPQGYLNVLAWAMANNVRGMPPAPMGPPNGPQGGGDGKQPPPPANEGPMQMGPPPNPEAQGPTPTGPQQGPPQPIQPQQ